MTNEQLGNLYYVFGLTVFNIGAWLTGHSVGVSLMIGGGFLAICGVIRKIVHD
jgi:hypothetical protein